jgi:xylulokinase
MTPGVHRFGLDPADGPGHVRGVIEAQMMALVRHSRWMQIEVDTIYATGGAAANVQILQVMADVFGADVHQLEVANSAALGAALRAQHADLLASGARADWDAVIAGLVEPKAGSRLRPLPEAREVYRDLLRVHGVCEAKAIGMAASG